MPTSLEQQEGLAGRDLDPKARHLQGEVWKAFIDWACIAGQLDDLDVADVGKVMARLREIFPRINMGFFAEYRDETILSAAYDAGSHGNYELAVMFYALFYEHSLNHIIYRTLERASKPRDIWIAAIRSLNLDAKMTWFLEVLNLPPISEQHRSIMKLVADERNRFVHYKFTWVPDSPTEDEEESQRLQRLLVSAKKTTTYLKRYEARVLYRGEKAKLQRTTRQIVKRVTR